MSKTDQRGARLRGIFRDTRETLASRGEPTGANDIAHHLRHVEPATLTPQEEDWLWDGGWVSRIGEALRSTATPRCGSPSCARRRTPAFDGRCYLCGQPIDCGGIFCYAHCWAARTQQ